MNNPVKYIDPSGEWFLDFLFPTAYAPMDEGHEGSYQDLIDTNSQSSSAAAVGLEVAPVTGDTNDLYSAVSGYSMITGDKLSTSDRVCAAIAVPIPIVAGSIVKAATDKAVHIALGLGENLAKFSEKVGALPHWRWHEAGIVQHWDFKTYFKEATDAADKIHFNLDGFDAKKAIGSGHLGPIDKNITNWEFTQVIDNPKTKFYKDDSEVSRDTMKKMIE